MSTVALHEDRNGPNAFAALPVHRASLSWLHQTGDSQPLVKPEMELTADSLDK